MRKFLAIFFAMMILLTGCSNEPPVSVKTEKVQLVDGNLSLTHEGIITLSDELEIRSPVSGNLVEKYTREGVDVTEDQPLLKISEFGPHADLLQIKTELAKAMTDLAKAQAENNPSADELKTEVEKNQAIIKQIEEDTAAGVIYAPKSGRLGTVDAPLGMLVTANETVVATIGNINPLAVRVNVSAEEARLLSSSDNLKVTLKFNDGTVYPIDGILDYMNDSIAEVTFDNSDGLLLVGMTVQVEFDGLKVSNTLLVPEKAIQQREDGNYVFAIDSNKKATAKKISLGDKLGSYFIVKEGLKADDSVVVEGQDNLREGTKVNL